MSKINAVTEAWIAVDSKAIDEALATAQQLHGVGLNLPPMTRQRGMRRKLAMLIARLFLRVAQIITRDQRAFNYSCLAAFGAIRDSVRRLEQTLPAAQEEVATRAKVLEEELAEVRKETAMRAQVLEEGLAEVRKETAVRVQVLEQGLIAARSCAYTFDEATRPGHVPLAVNQTPQEPAPIISYAQNREDILLRRVFPDRKTGFYIDVGAHDPVFCSVTKHFYDRGWHGINIEPLSEMFRRLCTARARDINLNCGLSNHEGILTFYESSPEPALSTFSRTQANADLQAGFEFVERQCPVTTLANVCEQYVRGEIDFISIDVEGHEREIIEGGDWKRWRPRVIVIEATKPYTNIPVHDRWELLLLVEDYLFATFDGINRYYVRAEDRQLLPALSTPVNVLDRYIPYEYLCQIEELKARIASYEGQRVSPEIHPKDFIFQFLFEHPLLSKEKAIEYYFNDGQQSAQTLRKLLNDVCGLEGKPVELLEFASGYGCVTRHLKNVIPLCVPIACDIHQEAVGFIVDHIGVQAVLSTPQPEDLRIAKVFDVVFALSFFSHMPKSSFSRWLRKLASLVKPEGFLIFTTHGLVSQKHFPSCQFDVDGFYFVPTSEQKDLSTEEYGCSVVTPDYVHRQLFEIPALTLTYFQEGYWWKHQDIYIVRLGSS